MKKLAIVSLLALAGASAQAQSVYGDVAYQTHDVDGASDAATLRATLGYDFSPAVSGELMLGFNAKESKLGTASVKIDQLVGIYAKPKMKLNDSVELYGRLGFVNYKLVGSNNGRNVLSTTDSGFSFGIGASYYVTPSVSINVDYMDFGDLEGGLAVGVKVSF